MTTSDATTATNPTLTAEGVGKRFLRLLEDVKSRSDLTIEHLQGVMGLTFKDSPNGLFYTQPLGSGWLYVISLGHETPPGRSIGRTT